MTDEETRTFVERVRDNSKQWPVKYFPSVDKTVSYPQDIFADQHTVECISRAFDLSVSKGKEVGLEGNIIGNNYTISAPIVGEEEMILSHRELFPTENNPYHPYQAIVFDFHTHPKNLTPSQSDLQGYLFAAGSMQRAILHKKSRVNPLFIIGRSIDGRKEMLCYQFQKEALPTPNNRREQEDFIQEYYGRLNPLLRPVQQMGDNIASIKCLDYFVNLMNSCDGIRAFGKII